MASPKIVSLWDLMRQFDGRRILEGLEWLSSLRTKWMAEPGPQLFSEETGFLARRQQIAELVAALEGACLPIAAVHAQNLLECFDAADSWENGKRFVGTNREAAVHYMNKLLSVAPDEAGTRRYLLVAPEQARLYDSDEPVFGETVASAFSSLSYEVSEAAKCLALGRSTASAFHSIRCLEAGIRAISRSLGIPDPTKGAERSWHKMLGAIRAAIDAKWPSRLSGDGALYDKWHAQLVAMQNPYRNATMHLDEKYTVEEAEHLFAMIKGLMGSIAGRIDEHGESKP